MKKITKVLSIALVVLFIAIPILQSLSGKGGVYAAEQNERTVSYDCKDESEAKNIPKSLYFPNSEVAIHLYNLYEYEVEIDQEFVLTGLTKNEAYRFYDGIKFTGTPFSNSHWFNGKATFILVNASTFYNKNDKKYTVTGRLQSLGKIRTIGMQKDEITNRTVRFANVCIDVTDTNRYEIAFSSSSKKPTLVNIKSYWNIKKLANQPTTDYGEYYKEMWNQSNVVPKTTENTYTYTNSSGNVATTSSPNITSITETTIKSPSSSYYPYVNIGNDQRRLFIRHLYKSVQRREPADVDYVNYMNRNVQTNAIDVIMSKEADEKNKISQMSNEEFIRFLYKTLFFRDPDATGLHDYLAFLNNGIPRTSVIKELCESVEFREKWGKQVKTLTFDANTCAAVHKSLSDKGGVHVYKASNTTIKMFADGVNNVKELNVSTKNLTNLNGLSQFPNLETLTAMNNNYTNISELSKLTNIKKLNLDSCNLSSLDLTPIKSMTKLEDLSLQNNGLTNRTLKVSGMPSIKKLDLKGNKISSVSETMLTNNLTWLKLDNNEVLNTEEVDYSNLKTISLKNNICGINGRGTKKIIPQIIKNAQNKSSKLYATNGLTFNKCKIVGNELVMDSGVATATVTIKGGPADGTVITLKNLDVAQ